MVAGTVAPGGDGRGAARANWGDPAATYPVAPACCIMGGP
jgi:hypothetical protein